MVERMQREINKLVRAPVAEEPDDWERLLKYAQCILRATPLKVLGDRSPHQVVTGLLPKLPSALIASGPTEAQPLEKYMEKLLVRGQETSCAHGV